MTFRIEQDSTERESFGNYDYRIYRGDKLIARYWHDYRGDEHGIDFVSGESEGWPIGRMIDFIEGGGRLSEEEAQMLNHVCTMPNNALQPTTKPLRGFAAAELHRYAINSGNYGYSK